MEVERGASGGGELRREDELEGDLGLSTAALGDEFGY